MSRMLREEDVLRVLRGYAEKRDDAMLALPEDEWSPHDFTGPPPRDDAQQHRERGQRSAAMMLMRAIRALPSDPRAEAAERLAQWLDRHDVLIQSDPLATFDRGAFGDGVQARLAAWREAQSSSSQNAPGSTTPPMATHRTPARENAHHGRSATPRWGDSEERP